MDGGGGRGDGGGNGKGKEEEQDGMSVHSPCRAARSSDSSLSKEQSEVLLELRFLEAVTIYHPRKLRGMHRHFVIYGLMEYLRRRLFYLRIIQLRRHFSPDEVLQLMDRFYNIEVMEPDEEIGILSHEEDFCLPPSYFVKKEQ